MESEDEITMLLDDVDKKCNNCCNATVKMNYGSLKIIQQLPQITIDALPKDIWRKIFFYLDLDDLFQLEATSSRLRELVLPYWKVVCERQNLLEDPTPLCVGWPLNAFSMYSYDNAVDFSFNSFKKWRLVALRHLLIDGFRCVICQQHLKDRLSVDGVYFKHDVLLCFPECYQIFTVNVNEEMSKICKKHGISMKNLTEIDPSYPVLLMADLIKKIREMGIHEKEILTKLRPYIGYSKEHLRSYFDYVESIRKYSLLI